LLELWTFDGAIARNSGPILAVLAAGTAVNGLTTLPTSLQLANGWTRLVIHVNVAAVALMAPAMYLVARHSGGIGAAWLWLALNTGYVLFMLPVMHRRLLPGHLPRWMLVDVGAPLALAVAVVVGGRLLFGVPQSYAMKLGLIAALSLLALLAAVLAAPEVRSAIFKRMAGSPQAKPAS
jgi:O-antigen/teichoic acid export membrane protein